MQPFLLTICPVEVVRVSAASNQLQIINQLRKLTAVIVLLVFFVSQYERQLGYANCRITNYFKPDGNKCDCEQLLENSSSPVADNTAPPVHVHHHPDESYFPPLSSKVHFFSYLNTVFSVIQESALPFGNVYGIDRPPQAG